MYINKEKTKVMIFKSSKKYDFMPEVKLEKGDCLEVVSDLKILGVVISSNMNWKKNTDLVCKKGYSKLWIIRRLKILGASRKTLLDFYINFVRSILEYAAPVWHPGLTETESNKIERIQKCALAQIFNQSS